MSINHATISGNLGRDAELRRTQSGMEMLTFSVAVNERRKNQTGEWDDYTNWIGCVMFGTRAGKVAEMLKKGTKVAVEGKLRYSEWDSGEGKRSKVEIIVDEIEIMSGFRKSEPEHVEAEIYSSDIPF